MENKITVQATINASVNKVWDYYTGPTHIVNWNFASDDWCCPKATNDLQVGGKYFGRMEAKDGSFGFDFEAIYNEVIPNSKIVYTMADRRIAEINFEDINKETKVEIIFDAENQNPIDMQRDGWQAILNNFKKYTEEN